MAELLTPIATATTGAVVGLVAAIGTTGNKFVNAFGTRKALVRNGDTNPTTVVFAAFGTCNFGVHEHTAHDLSVTVNGGVEKIIGPFDPNKFTDSDGYTWLICSNVTSVTVGCLE
jgi:hypothetical protein